MLTNIASDAGIDEDPAKPGAKDDDDNCRSITFSGFRKDVVNDGIDGDSTNHCPENTHDQKTDHDVATLHDVYDKADEGDE